MTLPILAALALGLTLGSAAVWAQTPENMVRNGGFEDDSDGDGMADHWVFSGDSGVKVRWSRDTGAVGRYSQKLECLEFRYTGPASHAMLAQLDTLCLVEGHGYRLSFWAKGQGIAGRAAGVAIQQTGPWENCGLLESFRVSPDWREVHFEFRATRTISSKIRLQFWFTSTGTLWLDDVRLVPYEIPPPRFTEVLSDAGGKNLIPNSSFECGATGWGSISTLPEWGGNMNSLFGQVDDTAAVHGTSSLKITLDPKTAPLYAFDYYEPTSLPVLNPVAAHRGWVSVRPGEPYTLSAWVKAAADGTSFVMAVHQAFRGTLREAFRATLRWERHHFTFRPTADQIFVGLGPDLTRSDLPSAVLWVDGVQLERGAEATQYEPRAPVEVGIEWEAPGQLFTTPQAVRPILCLSNATGEPRAVAVRTNITDFFDRALPAPQLALTVPAGGSVRQVLELELPDRGFFRLALASEDAVVTTVRPERLGIIPPCDDADGLFGMNHAYPWAELNRLSKRLGLTWFRDWSLKWTHVEPEKGRFDFAAADYQIERVLAEGLNVLPLLPFPSSKWSSTAPLEIETEYYPGSRIRTAYMPRDPEELADYVRACVRHYQGRLSAWEFLNEPIYTDYALPADRGYTVEDYVKLLEVAYHAIKEVDPQATVIGGIAGHPGTYTREFIHAGGLRFLDAINLHIYPGLAEPESYLAGLQELNAMMDEAGGRKPIWFTEGAYYADDDPPRQPYGTWLRMLDSEAECAAYQVRFNVILLSAGTRRIIYHSGTPGSLNNEEVAGIFFEWDGAPRKMAVSQATLTALLGPDTVPMGRVGDAGFVYAFHSRGKTVLVAWDASGTRPKLEVEPGAQVLDLAGRTLTESELVLDGAPLYVVLPGLMPPERLARAVQVR